MTIDLRRHIELIDWLDTTYPLKNFEPTTSEQTIREHCAKRDVVERLKRDLAYQLDGDGSSQSFHVLGTPEHV